MIRISILWVFLVSLELWAIPDERYYAILRSALTEPQNTVIETLTKHCQAQANSLNQQKQTLERTLASATIEERNSIANKLGKLAAESSLWASDLLPKGIFALNQFYHRISYRQNKTREIEDMINLIKGNIKKATTPLIFDAQQALLYTALKEEERFHWEQITLKQDFIHTNTPGCDFVDAKACEIPRETPPEDSAQIAYRVLEDVTQLGERVLSSAYRKASRLVTTGSIYPPSEAPK